MKISLRELNRSLDGWLKQKQKVGNHGLLLVNSKLFTDIDRTPTLSVTLRLKAEE
jgi:hypothetical protein